MGVWCSPARRCRRSVQSITSWSTVGLIVRTRLTAKVSVAVRSSADAGVVVAYEADDLDPRRRTGWSVVVTGLATEVSDPEQVARYQRLLHPWVNMAMDTVVAIEPEIVTGIRIVADSRTP